MNTIALNPVQEITTLHNQIVASAMSSLENAIRIGELLTEERAKLEHGQWLPWAKSNLPFTDQTARNYLRCFEKREELKFKSVLNLADAYRWLADEKTICDAAKEIRGERYEQQRAERIEKINEISKGNSALKTQKLFPVVLCDPPWRYEDIVPNRAVENHYPTMELADICNLPIRDVVTPDSILFMWATSPKLAEAMRVIEAWGYTYRTCAVWVKDKIGMGYYFRQQHELLLVATMGNPPVPEASDRVSSVIEAPRTKHSAKPEGVYKIIEDMYPDFEKLELFCRSPRAGWHAWGNQS